MIKPTVGRVVWFIPSEQEEKGFRLSPDQPCTAQIVYVWNEREVNLVIHTHEGVKVEKFHVPLMQEEDIEELFAGKAHAMWMPYQQGQAKKEK